MSHALAPAHPGAEPPVLLVGNPNVGKSVIFGALCCLVDLAPGECARVVLVAPRHEGRLEQLGELAVLPEAMLTLRQRARALGVEVDYSLLALESEIGQGIYVRPQRKGQ
jgi:hypothetical protein